MESVRGQVNLEDEILKSELCHRCRTITGLEMLYNGGSLLFRGLVRDNERSGSAVAQVDLGRNSCFLDDPIKRQPQFSARISMRKKMREQDVLGKGQLRLELVSLGSR